MFFTQEFSETATDYRIFVSKGKVIGGWKREAKTGFMTVLAKNSTYTYYNDPAPEIVDICERAAKAWEVDFMALDFMYKNDKPYILEFSNRPASATCVRVTS